MCLSHKNIILLLECALQEKKIAFVSQHISLLNLAAESLNVMMYPLSWQYVFIPILPSKLLGYLQAPVPFIVGIVKSDAADIPDDVRQSLRLPAT